MSESVLEPGAAAIGPVVHGPASRAVHETVGLGEIFVTGGPWGRWQHVNRDTSIPTGIAKLTEAGNLDNLKLAAGEGSGEYQGPFFMDSDLYKTLEAAGWEAGREPDPQLDDFITTAVELLDRAQLDDGYLNSWVQAVKPESRYTNLAHSHELYCAGHLIQAAVAVARGMRDERVLDIARRFADHLVTQFGAEPAKGLDGHPEVETALVELYRLTGERSYLDLARGFVETRGHAAIGPNHPDPTYFQDHAPIRDADTMLGHAVRALYLDAGVVDVYLETGDESLLESSLRRWHDMVATKTYVTGALGSRHSREAFGDRYELPPDRAYAETCAAIASIHWNWRLLLATGHGRHADLIERTLYNAFAASTSIDGERYFYVNPLQRRADHLEGQRVGRGRRQEWYSCACCPPNIMRLVSSLGHYFATVSPRAGETGTPTLHLHQYAPAEISTQLGDQDVALSVETDYPWSGSVRIRVEEGSAGTWALALRIPAWSATTYAVRVAGESADAAVDERGYVTLTREWQAGDVVELELDMTPRLVFPHPRIDAVRGTVAVERGPLVYCFEQADHPDADLDELAIPADAELESVALDDHDGLGRTVGVRVRAQLVRQPGPHGWPYSTVPPAEVTTTQPTQAFAVPYFQWDNRDGGAMRIWVPVTAT